MKVERANGEEVMNSNQHPLTFNLNLVLCIVCLLPSSTWAEDALRDTIDREVKAAWAKEELSAPERSTDTVFLRRVYLDLVGMIPTYEEATALLADKDQMKREKLFERLVADAG